MRCKKCVHIYVNAKMIPVKRTSGIRGGGMKENGRRGEVMYDILIHCKNLCKCHIVLPPSTTIKEKKKIVSS
jgi:predicted metallopeptidase